MVFVLVNQGNRGLEVGNHPNAHTTVDWRTLPEGVSLPDFIERDDEPYIIGEDVTREEGVRIGRDSKVEKGAFLGAFSTFGDNVIVGFDTIVEERVKIGDSKPTIIGSGCILEEGAIVEEDVVLGDGVHLMRGAWVKKGAKVGTIVGGTVIGEYAIVGAGAEIQGNMNKVIDDKVVEVAMVPAFRVIPDGAQMGHVGKTGWSMYTPPAIC
jgi:UDP-3-O-[3-hydroxymyristoyl] glucosamine N-acyltransferase